MFLIWLIYQSILDCFGLYMSYQMSGIDSSFMQFMPMPSLSTHLFSLALHGGLIYFICTPNIKALFQSKVDDEQLTEELEI